MDWQWSIILGICLWLLFRVKHIETKCLLIIASEEESILRSPDWPSGYKNNLNLCWVIRSSDSEEQVRLEIQGSSIQPKHYNGGWTDYVQVMDGGCDGKVLVKWSGTTKPDIIKSTQGELCLQFITDDSIRNKGFILNYRNTGGEGLSLTVQVAITVAVIFVSTIVIVVVVVYIVWKKNRGKPKQPVVHGDLLPDDSFPPSYSVAVRNQDRDRPDVQAVSEALAAASAGSQEQPEPDVVQPPPYTASVENNGKGPSLHRDSTLQYSWE